MKGSIKRRQKERSGEWKTLNKQIKKVRWGGVKQELKKKDAKEGGKERKIKGSIK